MIANAGELTGALYRWVNTGEGGQLGRRAEPGYIAYLTKDSGTQDRTNTRHSSDRSIELGE